MTRDNDESELVLEAVAGDRASLSQLLLIHYDELRGRIARRISTDLQGLLRPDDILQQAFVRAAESIGSFEPRHNGSFRVWLRTIALNLLKDAEKRRRRERRAPGRRLRRPALGGDSPQPLVNQIAADSTAPSGRAGRRENVTRLHVALAGLSADQREVIQRRYLQDQSFEQIAVAMDCTKDAVRGMCYRARKNLRAAMGRSSLFFSG